MKVSERTYRFTGITRMLGAQAANPKVRSDYIASKAPSVEKGNEETEMLPSGIEERGLTVFLRDKGNLCVADYVIKGFIKSALTTLKSQLGIVAPASKVDTLVLVTPAYLTITDGTKPVSEPDEVVERPLRAMTMQGPRVSVAASESVNAGWELTFTLHLIENAATNKSKALTLDVIEEAFDYGTFNGLGQWRNAQNGRFTWKRVG